jgi:hypothetical protein
MNLVDLVFHHPLEVAVQETVDKENIESPLMVGHKDVGLGILQVLAPFDGNRQQQRANNNLAPPMARIVSPEVAVADGTPDAHLQGGKNGSYDNDGNADKQLIETIEET